ncbi:hypothetical protein L0337_06025 [candidate division KSB1 bacterium]|nr:hypothetical protein [candidate division KSB1 bacterium]
MLAHPATAGLMVMSEAHFASEWSTLGHHTSRRAGFRDPTDAQRRFIPLLIEDCKLPDESCCAKRN